MENPFVRQLVCSARPRVEIDAGSGRLFLRGWDNGDVKVESASDKAPSIDNTTDKVVIEAGSCCDLTVYVPRQADVIIDGGDLTVDIGGVTGLGIVDVSGGQVTVSDWQGDLQVDTGNGNVRLDQVRGNSEVDTSGGSVEAASCQGSLTADTGSGSVSVSDSRLSLSADTGSGSVTLSRVQGPITVDTGSGSVELRAVSSHNVLVDTGRGEIRAELPGGNPGRWRLDSGGDISLQVPSNISARFRFVGRDLDVGTLDLQEMVTGRRELGGTLNQGQGRVHVEAGGHIRATCTGAAVTLDSRQRTETEDETLKILAMVEEGTITIEEAEKLLDALRGGGDDDE